MPISPVIVWFRQDLRLADHAALTAACRDGRPVIPLYILDDAAAGAWRPGGASRWWLHHSLAALGRSLEHIGSRLVLRRGDTVTVLREIARDTDADTVVASRHYEPQAARLEGVVRDGLAEAGVAFRRYGGHLFVEPETIRTGSGGPFKVFTPFWRSLQAGPPPARPQPAPRHLAAPPNWPAGDTLASWRLTPSRPDWAAGFHEHWRPGEEGAVAQLTGFLETAVKDYAALRDRPDLAQTSRLSPHLHLGEISPRQCWHAAEATAAAHPEAARGVASFLREVGWREFSAHVLNHWPALPEQPWRSAFARFPWRDDPDKLAAWQRGRTGYPLVDAGMRELWATGWMHNRVRMVAASFLVKHLLLPWQAGEAWFWDTLVDADLASNAASWQWVAGCGTDAAPYFRIFNPVKQGETFDPDGAYVKKWLSELQHLPTAHVHAPWQAPAAVLERAGIALGRTYPLPIVDHGAARERALAAFAALDK